MHQNFCFCEFGSLLTMLVYFKTT